MTRSGAGRRSLPRNVLVLVTAVSMTTLWGCESGTDTSVEGDAGPVTDVASGVSPTATSSPGQVDVEQTTSTFSAPASDSDAEAPTARPLHAQAPAELAPSDVVDERGDELVEPLIESTAELLADPAGLEASAMASVAAEEALAQVRSQTLEYSVLGWRQIGVPEVASARVLEVSESSDPPRVEVEVCLDHSATDIVDEAGQSVVDPEAPVRALTIFVLEFRDGAWVATDRQFPVETAC